MPNGRKAMRVLAALCFFALAIMSAPVVGASAQEAELESAEENLADLRGDLRATVDRYNELYDELQNTRAKMAVIELHVRDLAQDQLSLEKQAVVMARRLYKGGSIAQLEAILTAESFAEVQTHVKYLETSGQAGTEVFGKLAVDRQELEERLDELDEARESLMVAVSEMDDLRADIAGQIATEKDEIEALDAQLAREAEAVVTSPPPATFASPPVPPASSEADWMAIAMCESGMRWHLDSTYDGGLQFHPQTWLAYGGGQYSRYAWQATAEQQIAIAERVLKGQGPGAWPNCFQWKDE
ncbi:MAG: transglycosylase family protein [Actinomycetota bacterium]